MFSATTDMPWPPSGGEVLKGRKQVQMAPCPSTQHPPQGQVWSHPQKQQQPSQNWKLYGSCQSQPNSHFLPVHTTEMSHIFRAPSSQEWFTIFLWLRHTTPFLLHLRRRVEWKRQGMDTYFKRTLGGRQADQRGMGVHRDHHTRWSTFSNDNARFAQEGNWPSCSSSVHRHPDWSICSFISGIPPTLGFVSASYIAYKLQMGHLSPTTKMSKKENSLIRSH